MTDESEVLNRGPAAIVAAAAARTPLNWGVLAQACAREAYAAVLGQDASPQAGAALDDNASQWAEATIVCYDIAAAEISHAFTRQGLERIAHGWRTMCILRWGPGHGRAHAHLAESVAWVEAGVAGFPGPVQFRRLLHEDDRAADSTEALLLQERLQAASTLWRAGVLPSALDEWFHAAGIRGPSD